MSRKLSKYYKYIKIRKKILEIKLILFLILEHMSSCIRFVVIVMETEWMKAIDVLERIDSGY